MNLYKIKSFIPVFFSIIFFIWFFYFYWNMNFLNWDKNQDNSLNDNYDFKEITWEFENKFHISSIANSKEIEVKYEAIDWKNISWPVEINYKIYENGNIIKQWEYTDVKEWNYRTISIKRDSLKEYNIVSKIYENTWKLINDSSLKIKKQEKTPKKISLENIFQNEVEYIKNNINTIVSDFEKETTNWDWYTVDIKFIKKSNQVADLENWNSNLNADSVVIFEDWHYAYLAYLKKENNTYIVDWYYTFIQKPGEKVGWKNIETGENLEVWEAIYHWSIVQ